MRDNVEFTTGDNVILRGWLYKPDKASGPLPCLVMAHGFSATKEMNLDSFAEYFSSHLPVACLLYDHRGFGESDAAPGQPRQEIIPAYQQSDYKDAITYAQSRSDINPDKIGIWGSSYSGGHVLWVGAVDRRVRCVMSQMPCVDGWENFHRMIRPDFIGGLNQVFQGDRQARAKGEAAAVIPVVDQDVFKTAALPTADSYEYFFKEWSHKSNWKNQVTVRSLEAFREFHPSAHIHHISPTPLLMTVAENDGLTPADLALEAYSRAREPKQLSLLPGGHFDSYAGPGFERNIKVQAAFVEKHLCS